MADRQSDACTACGEPASMRCKGCIEGLNDRLEPEPTYYCGKTCQVAHWKQHKAQCKLSNVYKQLSRAGKLLQETFYAFREAVFEMYIESITTEGDKLRVTHANMDMEKDSPLCPFPSHLLSNDRDKKALLVYGTCGDVLTNLHALVVEVSKDLRPHLTRFIEVGLHFDRRHERILRSVDGHDPHYLHEAILISVKNGSEFILDITGAQYGQMRPILRFDEYKATYMRDPGSLVRGTDPFGTTKTYFSGGRELKPGCDGRVLEVQSAAASGFTTFKSEWEGTTGKDFEEVLKGPGEEFEAWVRGFAMYVRKQMGEFVAWMERKRVRQMGLSGDDEGSEDEETVVRGDDVDGEQYLGGGGGWQVGSEALSEEFQASLRELGISVSTRSGGAKKE